MGMKVQGKRKGQAFIPSEVAVAFDTEHDEEIFKMFLKGTNMDFCRQILDQADTDWLIANPGAAARCQMMLDAIESEFRKLG